MKIDALSMDKPPVPIVLFPAALGSEASDNVPPFKNNPPVNELDALLNVSEPAPSLVTAPPLIAPLKVAVVLPGLLTVNEFAPPVTVLANKILPD